LTDDLLRVDALLLGLKGILPIHATPTAELAAVMRKERPGRALPQKWRVTEVTYAGDPGRDERRP
jgi:hypothetical protein